MNKAIPKTIIKELQESQCMFFWSKKWTFPSSLIDSNEAWAITKQVYFRNVRKHRALAFALPYIVIEIPLAKDKNRARILLSYAADITLMIGAMDHFIKVEKGINAWLENLIAPGTVMSSPRYVNALLMSMRLQVILFCFVITSPIIRN